MESRPLDPPEPTKEECDKCEGEGQYFPWNGYDYDETSIACDKCKGEGYISKNELRYDAECQKADEKYNDHGKD